MWNSTYICSLRSRRLDHCQYANLHRLGKARPLVYDVAKSLGKVWHIYDMLGVQRYVLVALVCENAEGGCEPPRSRTCHFLQMCESIGVLKLERRSRTAMYGLTTQRRRASSILESSAHSCRAALTMASIPTFTASGRWFQASTTRARSSDSAYTLRAHFSCKNVLSECMECVDWGEAAVSASPPICIEL